MSVDARKNKAAPNRSQKRGYLFPGFLARCASRAGTGSLYPNKRIRASQASFADKRTHTTNNISQLQVADASVVVFSVAPYPRMKTIKTLKSECVEHIAFHPKTASSPRGGEGSIKFQFVVPGHDWCGCCCAERDYSAEATTLPCTGRYHHHGSSFYHLRFDHPVKTAKQNRTRVRMEEDSHSMTILNIRRLNRKETAA